MKQLDTLKVYEIFDENLEQLLDDIAQDNYMYKFDDDDIDEDALDFVRTLSIDVNSKYIGLVGKYKIMVIDIRGGHNQIPFEFEILQYPKLRLQKILDVHLESTGDILKPVKCFLACKQYQHKKIKILQIYEKPD